MRNRRAAAAALAGSPCLAAMASVGTACPRWRIRATDAAGNVTTPNQADQLPLTERQGET